MATQTSRYKQEGNFSQAKQRRGQMFRDQHGRRYFASIEISTGDPCGLIEPQFHAPLAVPHMYLERSPDEMRPYDLIVNYARWEADIQTERATWEKEGRQRAMKLHGDAYDPTKPFSAQVLDIIGPPPQAIEPIIAARQGNSWVLGLSTKVDLRLASFFEPEQLDADFRARNEPDFRDLPQEEDSELAEDDELDAIEDDADSAAAETRRIERERKRRQREQKRRNAAAATT